MLSPLIKVHQDRGACFIVRIFKNFRNTRGLHCLKGRIYNSYMACKITKRTEHREITLEEFKKQKTINPYKTFRQDSKSLNWRQNGQMKE